MSQPNENRLITSVCYVLYLLTVSDVLFSGCISNSIGSAAQATRVEYYPPCYEPVLRLCSTDNAVRDSAIAGTVIGDLLSGLAGGLVNDEDHGRNVAFAAVGGAPAGSAAGYYMERRKQISGDRARIGFYATDVDCSTVEINRSVTYVKSAQSCYQDQFKALLDDRKSRPIDEVEGRKRLVEIVSGLQKTNTLLIAANGRAGENINNYTRTYEKDLQQVGVPRIKVTKVTEVENRAGTTKSGSKPKTGSNPRMPKEAVATEQTVHKAQGAQNEGNKVASRGRGMIQEAYNSPDMGDWAPSGCVKT